MPFITSLVIVSSVLALPLVAPAQPGTASGTLTIDGTATTLSHAVRITKPNVFDDQSLDFIVVLSNQPLTAPQASDDALLLSRAQTGGLVTMAMRYDGRKGRGEKLFNATLRFKGAAEPVLLPDLFFKNTFKGGVGTLAMEKREFTGHTYEANIEFTVPVPKETTDAAAAAAPKTGAALPPPSKTEADRKAASALLIATLQEGDETRALEIVKLGIDPNAHDQKMNIALINWAVLMCQPLVVKELVGLKADLTHERIPGMTLLSEAAAACPDAVAFLKAGGAK
jgi:hypothetical protein